MTIERILRATLLGCALCGAPIAAPFAQAETLRVVEGRVGSILNVAMNRAIVVESDTPFAELSIANPAIADISSLSDRSIYVLGKAPGTTTLSIFNEEGQLITNVDVRVSADVAEFKERLTQILPNEPIEVRTANDGVVLSGTVSSIQARDRAEPGVEPDAGRRRPAGHAEGPFRGDAPLRVEGAALLGRAVGRFHGR